jgi:glycosyltransferase involved in cell wall biosynthesis
MERDASRLLVVRRMSGPVVLASYTGVMGGAERVLLDAAVRLERPVVVICPEGPLAEAVRAAGLPHAATETRPLALGAAHAAGLLAFGRELARLSRGAGVLVAWGARAVLAAALVRRRPPLLAVHHDLLPGAQVPSRSGPRVAAARAAARAALRGATRRADGVAAASEAIARELGLADVAILHPGVDLAAFSPLPMPAGPPRALVLGALVRWKRPDLAIHVADHMPELHVTIAGAPLPGSDGYADHLRERAALLGGRVTLAGHVDPRAALAQAHVLLHCADAEPYGLALVEALACGRPVVARDAAGPREIVQAGAGRLYPAHSSVNGIAIALDAVLADPVAPAAARRRAEAAFDVEASTRRLARAIERVERA